MRVLSPLVPFEAPQPVLSGVKRFTNLVKSASWASASTVNASDSWISTVQTNNDANFLEWCWYSTRYGQTSLHDAISYNEIKMRACVWATIIKSGPDFWWASLEDTDEHYIETWAIALGNAHFGRFAPLLDWLKDEYQRASPCSKELQIYWELALLSLRELDHMNELHEALWPMFLNTLTHSSHIPENLPFRIIPDMVRGCEDTVPQEFWSWFDHPLFVQALPHEKHVKPGTWSILWHAWIPQSWRYEIAVRLVETIETALANGHTVRIPDDLRTIWLAGASFPAPYNILLARAMLINPRTDTENPWSLQTTEHWLSDMEHFYPETHLLKAFHAQLDGLSVEDARSWLTQRAFPAQSEVKLPTENLILDEH